MSTPLADNALTPLQAAWLIANIRTKPHHNELNKSLWEAKQRAVIEVLTNVGDDIDEAGASALG